MRRRAIIDASPAFFCETLSAAGSVDSAKGALLEAGEGDAGGDSSKQRREKQEPGFPSLEWWKKYL